MRAGVLTRPKQIAFTETTAPVPGPDEVLIRIAKVGICGSDVHLFEGHRPLNYPQILGHEAIGQIEGVGAQVDRSRIGERVVIEPNIACGSCRFCQEGRGSICPEKKVLGLNAPGCFAEYAVLKADYAWALPASISDEDAVTIEPMSVAYHALKLADLKPKQAIAIIGLGAIGLLITHLAVKLGYRVYVSELNMKRLAFASSLGANPVGSDSTDEMCRIWQDKEVCTVFECAGTPSATTFAISAAPRGTQVILTGLSVENATFQPLKLVREGISIVPSLIYDHPGDFSAVIELILEKTISPSVIISNQMPFHQLQQGFEDTSAGVETKVVINL